MNNFAISSLSRSGTTFLARVMDKSKRFRVYHERDKHVVQGYNVDLVQKRFKRERYGEVSSRLRFVLPLLSVGLRGVILRNPYDIFVSVCNRRDDMEDYTRSFGEHFLTLESLIRCAHVVIRFEHMVSSTTYLTSVLHKFGITDVRVTDEILHTRVNTTREYTYHSFRELPQEWQESFERQCGWFIKRYNYNFT